MSNSLKRDFIELRHFDTYNIAAIADGVVSNQFVYLRNLEEIFGDQGILGFVKPFKKRSALHLFLEEIILRIFDEDFTGEINLGTSATQVGVLPIEIAFEKHGIDYETFDQFRERTGLPPLSGDYVRALMRIQASTASDDDHRFADLPNEYSDYWEELTITSALDRLLQQMAEEVFFILFINREFLENFNRMMAVYVSDVDFPELPSHGDRYLLCHFRNEGGRLRRKPIPSWVRRAVEFRDRGLCTYCQKDLSSLRSPLNMSNFDHIVPLSLGGLNDVSNIQLLCQACNLEKSDRPARTGKYYQRWFPREHDDESSWQ
ncbi:HNH endonuclease [Streptomonospora wellingtoniae]|uniref:HNH endonuclease signature motif containing protein n=1 Tax=Streptomonospora wellingtoniae TaxID=3075544 RepID=A0ABU2KXH6_9ACTN|nr:HNH endonuclease signature motif containing protein [Streptomonospora sp. DSM 45055]MDT0304000.1 HNH endonuclease signature motif containing protein [Streptomonospora sp. DSM 45055]